MEEFWDIAYRDNAPALLGILRRYVKDESIAQDLLHEVFITAIDKYDSYAGKGSFEGWLYRVAVNTALMYLRNERNRYVTMDVETWCAASLPDGDDTGDRQIDDARAAIEAAEFSGEELLAAIDRLPEHHKLVFNMYVMDDFSHRQIATELNISQGTSKSHLARARKKIQHFLYEDAMNRKKIRDKRWASALLLLFPAKEHYIDRLYRKGLSNFRLLPTGGAEFLSTVMEQHAASVASTAASPVASALTQTAFWGGKLSYIAACCGTAAITGTACWLTMSVNSPLNGNDDRTNLNRDMVSDTLIYSPDTINEDTFVPDSAIYDGKDAMHRVSAEAHDSTPPPNEKTPAPVVVKKQIIQHQTVVVRDTIFIIEDE